MIVTGCRRSTLRLVPAVTRRPTSSGARLLRHDQRLGVRHVAGADEAGRGALAGPLVTAAVLLEPAALRRAERRALAVLDDSKRCTHARRETLLGAVLGAARRAATVVISVAEIDAGGVHRANLGGLARALQLTDAPDDAELLVDGFRVPLDRRHRPIVDGDATSAAIAAASILAKVTRDRMLHAAATRYAGYGFERHVGYGTPEHLDALRALGPTPLHRRSFAPCAQLAFDV